MDEERPIVKLDKVTKIYREHGKEVVALKEISLDVFRGDFLCVTGPSGSGKSTLLYCMGLLDRPTKGKIYIEGKDTSKLTGREVASFRGMKMGFIFQNYNLIPRLSAIENVMLPAIIAGKRPGEVKERARELLESVGLKHREDHRSISLSCGEQQRVAIARALINDPIIILADEPTGALDSQSGEEIMHLIKDINESRGVAVVVVTHDPTISSYGRRVITLRDGVVVSDKYGSKC